MFDSASWPGSILIDTIGHCLGVMLFGLLMALFLRAGRFESRPQNRLSVAAAALVLLWNLFELVNLAEGQHANRPAVSIAATLGFCCLSVLPALLLDTSLQNQMRGLATIGYALSATAILVQYAHGEFAAERSRVSLLILSFGFAFLSLGAWIWSERGRTNDGTRAAPNRIAFVALFIFATSFVHFQAGHTSNVWVGEAVWHHMTIPIALIVLLRDYRFLLLDVFLRFAVSATWITAWLWAALEADRRLRLWPSLAGSEFGRGVLLVTSCLLIYLLAKSLLSVQSVATRVVFRRPPFEPLLTRLIESRADNEADLLQYCAGEAAGYFTVGHFELVRDRSAGGSQSAIVLGPGRQRESSIPSWAVAYLPVRFAKGDGCRIFFGIRAAGRRFVSEDLTTLDAMGTAITERVERLRADELGELVSQAELRALQAQINPHFFFNALNTLYGTIGSGSAEAKKLVLNLAEVFRARLQNKRTYVPVSEELDLVRAYLEIEAVRWGPRLTTHIDAEPGLATLIPVLTIQPLVENAIRHGASADGRMFVRLRVRAEERGLAVSIEDRGQGFAAGRLNGKGVGLENVRARLRLCYGPGVELHIATGQAGSTVSFILPQASIPKWEKPDRVAR